MIEYHCDLGQSVNVTIDSGNALRRIADSANPGDVIHVRPGPGYKNIDVAWTASGKKGKPITVRIDREVILENTSFDIEGDWVYVMGGTWRNGQVQISGDQNRMTRGYFVAGKSGGNNSRLHSAVCVRDSGSYNRVDHNLVENWLRRGIRQAYIRDGVYNLFDHNYLLAMNDGRDTNGREALQIGSGHNEVKVWSRAVFTRNRLENYSLESEAISIKSNGNTVSENTFIDCPNSAIVCRSGSENSITGNWLSKTRGIRIYGDENDVISNVIRRGGEVRVYSGDCNVEQLRQGRFKGGHPAARLTTVVGNEVAVIEVGRPGRGRLEYYDEQWLPAEDTNIEQPDSQVKFTGRHRNTDVDYNYLGDLPDPKHLARYEVGLYVDDNFCAPTPPLDDEIEKLREDVDALKVEQEALAEQMLGLSEKIADVDERLQELEES